MRGLTENAAARWRDRGERGAVAVMVALLMIPLLGVAALVVDLADVYASRQRLQTGADAAALAIATDCLRGSCGSSASTATAFAVANLGRTGTPTATVTAQTGNSVTVSNTVQVQHIFAPAIGISSTKVGAQATATWSAPRSGTSVLPLVINACEYNLATGGGLPSGTSPRTLSWSGVNSGCYAARGILTSFINNLLYYQPGGFAWVKTGSGCSVASSVDSELQLSTSSSPPSSGCTAAYFAGLRNTTVLLPVFDDYRQPSIFSSTAYFNVYGYAAFQITGYYFGSGISYNTTCNGSQRCLHGYFTRLADQAPGFTYGDGGGQLGAGTVTLAR